MTAKSRPIDRPFTFRSGVEATWTRRLSIRVASLIDLLTQKTVERLYRDPGNGEHAQDAGQKHEQSDSAGEAAQGIVHRVLCVERWPLHARSISNEASILYGPLEGPLDVLRRITHSLGGNPLKWKLSSSSRLLRSAGSDYHARLACVMIWIGAARPDPWRYPCETPIRTRRPPTPVPPPGDRSRAWQTFVAG